MNGAPVLARTRGVTTPLHPPAAPPPAPQFPWVERAGDWAARLLLLTAGLCPTLASLGTLVGGVLLTLAAWGVRHGRP